MKPYDNKHVFLVSNTDVFSPLYLDALLYKVNIPPESICVVYFKSNTSVVDEPNKIDGIKYISFFDADKSIFISAKTITYFSLSTLNSLYVRKVLELDSSIKDKCYMFITDDEVDRWLKCIVQHGYIKPDDKLMISDNDVWVLGQQQLFITVESTFRNKLNQVLGRENYQIVDSSVVFDTLPTKSAQGLALSVLDDEKNKRNMVLLGTKPNAFEYQDIKKMLHAFVTRGVNKDFKFVVMWPAKQWRKRILLDLYLFYLHKVKKQPIDISILTSLPPLAYTSMVMSCTHLVLQPRGGASTARQLMKWGQGKVCVAKGSYNELFFKDAQSIDLVSFASFSELAENLNEQIDIKGNAFKINAEEQRSLSVLAKLYS